MEDMTVERDDGASRIPGGGLAVLPLLPVLSRVVFMLVFVSLSPWFFEPWKSSLAPDGCSRRRESPAGTAMIRQGQISQAL